jgi:MOSC domain-containing protein YiiM
MSVISVAKSPEHHFSKPTTTSITLVKDLGVEGDAHYGPTVMHRSRLHIRPVPKNLRQVHLMPVESLRARDLLPGAIGENIATEGLDLLAMPTGTRLRFVQADERGDVTDDGRGALDKSDGHPNDDHRPGSEAPVVVLTGVRNPCPQIDKYRRGLQESFIVRDSDRKIVKRLAGVMGTVEVGGIVTVGMRVLVEQPEICEPLAPV